MVVLNNKSNCIVLAIIGVNVRARDDPVWADIIAISSREPILQNLVIKRVKLFLREPMVIVQVSSFVQDIPGVTTTTQTKNYR